LSFVLDLHSEVFFCEGIVGSDATIVEDLLEPIPIPGNVVVPPERMMFPYFLMSMSHFIMEL
jgi:hypothetical protein